MYATKIMVPTTIVLAGLLVSCSAPPKQKPRILSSVTPGGAPQTPPLGSSRPVQVPTAPVGTIPQAVGAPIVPVAPGAPLVTTPGNPFAAPLAGNVAPPGAAVPVQTGVMPLQPGQIALPAPNGASIGQPQPLLAPPTNIIDGSGTK